jgi:hypothetical protein
MPARPFGQPPQAATGSGSGSNPPTSPICRTAFVQVGEASTGPAVHGTPPEAGGLHVSVEELVGLGPNADAEADEVVPVVVGLARGHELHRSAEAAQWPTAAATASVGRV